MHFLAQPVISFVNRVAVIIVVAYLLARSGFYSETSPVSGVFAIYGTLRGIKLFGAIAQPYLSW